MKNVFRTALCAAVMTAAVCVHTFAVKADAPVPAKQGAFYVLANDQYVTFTDAVPQIRNSRSCLPFVAVFQQLGFSESDMTWDAATRTVTATNLSPLPRRRTPPGRRDRAADHWLQYLQRPV